MICKLGGFITQHYYELRDVEARTSEYGVSDVETEPVLQDIAREI